MPVEVYGTSALRLECNGVALAWVGADVEPQGWFTKLIFRFLRYKIRMCWAEMPRE